MFQIVTPEHFLKASPVPMSGSEWSRCCYQTESEYCLVHSLEELSFLWSNIGSIDLHEWRVEYLHCIPKRFAGTFSVQTGLTVCCSTCIYVRLSDFIVQGCVRFKQAAFSFSSSCKLRFAGVCIVCTVFLRFAGVCHGIVQTGHIFLRYHSNSSHRPLQLS